MLGKKGRSKIQIYSFLSFSGKRRASKTQIYPFLSVFKMSFKKIKAAFLIRLATLGSKTPFPPPTAVGQTRRSKKIISRKEKHFPFCTETVNFRSPPQAKPPEKVTAIPNRPRAGKSRCWGPAWVPELKKMGVFCAKSSYTHTHPRFSHFLTPAHGPEGGNLS